MLHVLREGLHLRAGCLPLGSFFLDLSAQRTVVVRQDRRVVYDLFPHGRDFGRDLVVLALIVTQLLMQLASHRLVASAEEIIPRHPRVVSAAIAARLRLGPLGLRRLGRRVGWLWLRAAHQLLDLLDGLPGRAPDVVHQLRDLLFDGAQFVIQGGALPLALEVAVLDRVGVRR